MSALSVKSSLEIENSHLREALSFAKRGWEDALALLKNTPNVSSSYLREGENVLEISSLQMELESLHKNMFQRAQQAAAFKTRLMQATNQLAAQVEDLSEMIKCPPAEGSGVDAGGSGSSSSSMVEELSYVEGDADIDEQLLSYCAKVEGNARRIASLSAFIKRSSEPYDNGEAGTDTGPGTGSGVTGSKSKSANSGGGAASKKTATAAKPKKNAK